MMGHMNLLTVYLLGAVCARRFEIEATKRLLRMYFQTMNRLNKGMDAAASEAADSINAFAAALGDIDQEVNAEFDGIVDRLESDL